MSDVVLIPVGKLGERAMVDTEDADLLQHSWHVHGVPKSLNRYACRTLHPNARHVFMHHVILPKRPGLDVDHIDGDTLNNRRSNLRYLTRSANLRAGWERRRARLHEARTLT